MLYHSKYKVDVFFFFAYIIGYYLSVLWFWLPIRAILPGRVLARISVRLPEVVFMTAYAI